MKQADMGLVRQAGPMERSPARSWHVLFRDGLAGPRLSRQYTDDPAGLEMSSEVAHAGMGRRPFQAIPVAEIEAFARLVGATTDFLSGSARFFAQRNGAVNMHAALHRRGHRRLAI